MKKKICKEIRKYVESTNHSKSEKRGLYQRMKKELKKR